MLQIMLMTVMMIVLPVVAAATIASASIGVAILILSMLKSCFACSRWCRLLFFVGYCTASASDASSAVFKTGLAT